MYFPFMVQLSGKTIAVVGGGGVAYRKCALFLDFGADIRVISPTLCDEFQKILPQITYIASAYTPQLLKGAFAAVAATDDRQINAAVSADCSALGLPVNVVDEPALCSFFVPATLRRGELTIGVSTGGKSPSLAGRIRRELAESYGEDYARRLSLLGRLREAAKRALPDAAVRRRLLCRAPEMEPEELERLICALEQDSTEVILDDPAFS